MTTSSEEVFGLSDNREVLYELNFADIDTPVSTNFIFNGSNVKELYGVEYGILALTDSNELYYKLLSNKIDMDASAWSLVDTGVSNVIHDDYTFVTYKKGSSYHYAEFDYFSSSVLQNTNNFNSSDDLEFFGGSYSLYLQDKTNNRFKRIENSSDFTSAGSGTFDVTNAKIISLSPKGSLSFERDGDVYFCGGRIFVNCNTPIKANGFATNEVKDFATDYGNGYYAVLTNNNELYGSSDNVTYHKVADDVKKFHMSSDFSAEYSGDYSSFFYQTNSGEDYTYSTSSKVSKRMTIEDHDGNVEDMKEIVLMQGFGHEMLIQTTDYFVDGYNRMYDYPPASE